MNKLPTDTLDNLAQVSGAESRICGEAKILKFENSDITVVVTVPFDVLEWFVDASELRGNAKTHWSCDYEGYDDTPREKLVNRMCSDIETIVGGLFEGEIRLAKRRSSLLSEFFQLQARYELEWKSNGNWEVALP